MTKVKDIKIGCRNCRFGEQPCDWYYEMGLVCCNNEVGDHYGHILTTETGCRYGRENEETVPYKIEPTVKGG